MNNDDNGKGRDSDIKPVSDIKCVFITVIICLILGICAMLFVSGSGGGGGGSNNTRTCRSCHRTFELGQSSYDRIVKTGMCNSCYASFSSRQKAYENQ